jgi:hypothetical protein
MQLQVGDRLVDKKGEWEVASRPYVTNAGKDAHVRVKKVGPARRHGDSELGRARAGRGEAAVARGSWEGGCE